MSPRPRFVWSANPAFFLLFALICALATSCSEDSDDTIVRPLLSESAPKLPIPLLRLDPEFASRDSLPRHARGFVMGQLNRVRHIALEAATAMPILNGSRWLEGSGACRYQVFGAPSKGNCSYAVYVCAADGGYEWKQVVDGPCGLDRDGPISYDNWIRFQGFSTEDATSGEFTLYLSDSGRPSQSWEWSANAERTVVDWSFYRESPSTESLIATLRVDERTPGRWQGELVWDTSSKWTADLSLDGTNGRMTALAFDRRRDEWIPQQEMSWVPAHGSWKFYDSSGSLLETRTW